MLKGSIAKYIPHYSRVIRFSVKTIVDFSKIMIKIDQNNNNKKIINTK